MAGEAKQTYATKELDTELYQEEKKPASEQLDEKALKGSPEHFQNGSVEAQTVNNKVRKFVEKEKDNIQQREAIIRPQQAGKIDFKSLQNRSKFSSDGTWPSGKSSPQSPSGKRNRDKGKKSGKAERGNPQQLYRLSITNPRSNPTIGIAYPQQKLSPPKKLDASRGPISGSYRFHVPSIPERESELQQEEFTLGRCFQEGSSNLNSPSYSSQPAGSAAVGPSHQHPPSSASQQPGALETSNTQHINQMLFPEFQLSGADMWQSPDRTFNNASFAVQSQKSNSTVDVNKTNGFVPLPFQYAYPLLDDTVPDSFPCDRNSQPQDVIEASLGLNPVNQNSFSFQLSGEEKDVVQNNTQFSYEQSQDRPRYSLHSKPPQFVQSSHGKSVQCRGSIGDDVSSRDSSESSNDQSDRISDSLSDKSDNYCPVDPRDAGVAVGAKRSGHLKSGTANQRVLIQGSVQQIRNTAQGQSPQMHFSKKAFNGQKPNIIPMGSAPHDKSHSRVAQTWEGPNKTFTTPLDQNSTPYPFQCQPPLEQRQNTGINSRMPWQQKRLTAALPNQNRIELSRQISNPQMAFLITQPDWKDDSKSQKCITQKSPNSLCNNKTNEDFSKLKQDSTKHGCSIISHCQFTNKVDSNQSQAGDAKNKALYFGVNHAVHVSTPRAHRYPPLHVPPMDLMMVSPYDSPSHSPIHNQMSSSTCSSLSPDSTSPASISSDDSSNSKVSPHQFYNQHQSKTSLDNLSSNQSHYHSEVARNLHYNQEKAKESFPSNFRHLKSNGESGKGCMDNYVMDHHPPPPYSAHQLLATSLENLDQLDMLLTCKQCDKNFNNLSSFLDHKQYCGQHTFAQNDFKDVRKVEDTRKFHTEHTKAISSGTSSFVMSRSSSDLHLSLLGLNKNGEIIPDSDSKVDPKDDHMKLMLPSAPLPDLEMEDAKLDSLITEALNGLGYQSDNAEIDSSFMDAFGDDEITNTKCSTNKTSLKTKDSVMFESRSKHEFTSSEKSLKQGKYSMDSDLDCLGAKGKLVDIIHKDRHLESEAHEESSKDETSLLRKESTSDGPSTHTEWVKETQKTDKSVEGSECGPGFLLSKKFSVSGESGEIKTLHGSTSLVKASIAQSPSTNKSPTSQRSAVRDGKRKRISGGSWSKELIHKIVQQKNKLHKLHVKGTKNMQFSLVMERVTPTIQNPTFREYDYVSDSDEDCEPVKIASQGRLSQSIRCRYTYTKECKGRIRAEKNREGQWRQDKIESFESKRSEAVSPPSIREISGHQRVRRQSNRSSTSSELSTSVSISSESISSPKSSDHTDSDCEKRVETKKKDQDLIERERSPQRILKESSTSLALTFTKNTKHYSTDKLLLSELKDSYTTTKCSNVISTTEETAEHTLTKSTVSLARFKTRVEVKENMDHYGCENRIAKSTEVPKPLTKDYKDHLQDSMNLRRTGVPLNPPKTSNDKEINHLSKIKKDNISSKGKHKKREGWNSQQDSNSKAAGLESFSHEISLSKDSTAGHKDLSEPPSLCSSLMDEVCLSPSKHGTASPQKDRNCLMPYTLESDQSLMKSPLSFDTSSMFADLTVSGFDNNLYPDIQLAKEGFSPMETTTDKKELFDSTFSPLLEQRDWNMIVDVTPELPDEIAQYKEDSDSTNDKKTCFNNVPFTMTEKIMDYHSNLHSYVSDDELEIKRIVTELESQIQSSKLNSPSPLDSEPSKHLTVSKFSPLRLDHESEDEQSILEVVCPSESLALVAPTGSHSELFSETDLPWSSPVPFELMSGQQCLHTPTHPTVTDIPNNVVHNNMDVKGETDLTLLSTQSKAELNINEKTEDSDMMCLDTDKSEEMIEHEIYRENLMKSLEVISDSLSSGLESPQSPLQQNKYGADEQQEKQNTETIKTTNQTENVDSYSVTQQTKCSIHLTKELLDKPCVPAAHDICELKLKETNETFSVGQSDEISLHDEDTHVNELHHERTYKDDSVNKSEDSSNKFHLSELPVIIFEQKDCKSPLEDREIGLDEQILKDFNSQGLANSLSVTTTFLDGLKDESMMDQKQKTSQELLLHTNSTEDYKSTPDSTSAHHSTQGSGTKMDTTEIIKDHVDPGSGIVIDGIGSSHGTGAQTHVSLQNGTDTETNKKSQMDKQKQYYEDMKDTSYTTLSAEHSSCEVNVQININDDSKLEAVSPVSPTPVVPPYVSSNSTAKQNEEIRFRCCWTSVDIMTPALAEKAPAFQNLRDEGVGSLHNCETSTKTTDVNIPFASHLDFAETTESRTILAVDNISNQAFCEPNEKSDPLAVTGIRDTLHDFKLSPVSYSETHFNDSSVTCSESLNKIVDDRPNIKSSPKDSLDTTACGLNLNEELSSNCRLSPIHVQNELELTTYGHFVKLDISHFHDTTSQNDISYIPTTHDHEETNASDDKKHLTNLHQGDIPLNSTEYMDMHINLLRNTDDEHVDSQIATLKLDSLSQRSTMSNSQEAIHTNKPRPTESKSFRSVSTSLMGQSEVKSSPKKSCIQNAVQGKFQCEICLMYFRTAPGLKRHKAMKHTVKAEGKNVQSSTLSSQGLVKDGMVSLDPIILLHQEGERTPAIQCDQSTLDSVFEDTEKQSLVSKSTKSNDKEKSSSVTEKAKKNNKVKKSKSADNNNNEGFIHKLVKQDPFPDELLTILKTDILQAISPEFPTMAQSECPKSPQKEVTNNLDCWKLKVTEEDQGIQSTSVGEQQATTFSKSPEMYNDVAEIEHTTTNPESSGNLKTSENNHQVNSSNTYADPKECIGIKEICDPCTDPPIKCETTSYPRTETNIHCESYKDQPLSPSGFGPDLKALFDDENTFSQLFPMNDEMKRKKCARVYGKSNKKQKQMPSLISDSAGPEFLDKNEDYKEKTAIFVSNLNDHCEYETILLDDAKMLEMCHTSTLKSSPRTSLPKDAKADSQTDYENTAEGGNRAFLSQSDVLNEKSSVNLDDPEDISIKSIVSTDAQGNCRPEDSCHLQLVSMDDNAHHYPSIDIQKLNTTFQLPEMQLFESERDLSLIEAIAPKKSPKKSPERKSRKRIETGLKPKDKQYKCKVCFTWFLTLGELDFHKLSHNPSPPPTCYMCVQRKFSSREQLRDHLREKHVKNKAGVWTCGMCLKEITDVWMYNEHLREHATQFARRGQSQGSLLDMPGCFMQENAVKNFISSIMQHQSKKAVKGGNAKSSKEEKNALLSDPELEQKSSDLGEPESLKPKLSAGGGSKHAAFTPFEVLSKEITPKNIEMHPNCKDPSRDCHHCGKQFPKPFKLQRHLVVHNLQKIFMCHKCPVSYQQANELKDHLKNEHEEVDEHDSKHTTLYTCELCADVMHVIKKSFICSTCNYTFSKKEQFDRHMEKHLAGANKIFKFKAVVRPCEPYKSKDDKFDMPPNKKQKVIEDSQERCLDSDIANTESHQNSDPQDVSPVMENSTCNNTAEELTQTNSTYVKIEDMAEDLSEVLDELGHCQAQIDSAKHTHLTKPMPKEEANAVSNGHGGQDTDTKEVTTNNKSLQDEICDVKIEDECGAVDSRPPTQISTEGIVHEKSNKECTGFSNADETMETEESDQTNLQNLNQASKIMKSQGTEDLLTNEDTSLKTKQSPPVNEVNQSKQDQMNECSSILKNKNEQAINQTEQQTCVILKDKMYLKAEESKQTGATGVAGVNQITNPLSSITPEDKDIIKLKKRKAPKTIPNSPRTTSPATRENLGIDPKVKKKFRSNACERLSGQRKADSCGDYLVLTSVKDDTSSNKMVSKQKMDIQPKRGPSDHFTPKKGEIVRHTNWDYRSKKGVPRKHVNSATSKVSVTTMNNSFNKPRPKSGLKAGETHSYHSAESHNNVLSKLFGQRLTSFKIPLRKDTSESIN